MNTRLVATSGLLNCSELHISVACSHFRVSSFDSARRRRWQFGHGLFWFEGTSKEKTQITKHPDGWGGHIAQTERQEEITSSERTQITEHPDGWGGHITQTERQEEITSRERAQITEHPDGGRGPITQTQRQEEGQEHEQEQKA